MAATLRSALSGWKTYIVAVLGVVYALGIKFGHWPNEPEIWAGLGFTGVVTLRAAIAKLCAAITAAAPPAPVSLEFDDAAARAQRNGGALPSIILAGSLFLLGLSGCQNMTPEQQAQWNATANTVAQRAADLALNAADARLRKTTSDSKDGNK
jgi:hypothetical protein